MSAGAMRRAIDEQLGHLLGDPEPAVGLEGVGGPQRRALLLLAAVAVESEPHANQLPDRNKRTAMFEFRFRINDQLPRFVAMFPESDHFAGRGLARDSQCRSFVPPATVDDPRSRRTCRDHGCCPRAVRRVDDR